MVNRFTLKAVMDSINRAGLPTPFIAGGYARDEYFKRIPKDADVFIPLGSYASDAEVYQQMRELADKFSKVGHCIEIHQAYGTTARADDFNERLYGVLKIDEIDVLFSRCASLTEVLDSFDSNLSQGYIVPASNKVHWHHGAAPTAVYTLKNIPMKRLLRLSKVAAEIGLDFEMRHEVQL